PFSRGGAENWARRGWLPLGLFGLWVTGTGVHLYCLGYVYDFVLRSDMVAPAVWSLAWAVAVWSARVAPTLSLKARSALWLAPFVAALLAASQPGKPVFLALIAANLIIYGYLYSRSRSPLVLQLVIASLLAFVAALPESWGLALSA